MAVMAVMAVMKKAELFYSKNPRQASESGINTMVQYINLQRIPCIIVIGRVMISLER